jgi:hypothetical protein
MAARTLRTIDIEAYEPPPPKRPTLAVTQDSPASPSATEPISDEDDDDIANEPFSV